jgi:acyl carrier protein
MEASAIRSQIKRLIVERLHLDGLVPEEIDDGAPLFESLGLDSVDALELVLGLEQGFGVKIANRGIDRKAFASVTALGDFVAACLEKQARETSAR